MYAGVYPAFESHEEFISIKEQTFDKNVNIETRCLIRLLEQEALQDPKVTIDKALESILHWNGHPPLSDADYRTTVRYYAIDELGLWSIAEHNVRDYVKLKYVGSWKR